MSGLKKLLVLLILVILSAPLSVMGQTLLQPSQPEKQALLISSLNSVNPMGDDLNQTLMYLKTMRYNTTYIADSQVTIPFILHNLGNFSVVIWRTNVYIDLHTVYWYLGQGVTAQLEQQYAADFGAGWLNGHAGVIGFTQDFIQHHFKAGSLNGVRLLIFIGSYGNSIVPPFLSAGVHTVIFCNGIISLQGGLIDDLTVSMLDNLAKGQDVQTAVFNAMTPVSQYSSPQDPIDSTYPPPFWYNGDASLTLV
jgi:hypothetical protein